MRAWAFAGFAALVVTSSGVASAQDLGDALEYIKENAGASHIRGHEARAKGNRHEKIAVINSRHVEKGQAPESYSCLDSPIDADTTLRSSDIERWADRRCRELMWRQDQLKGYKTLGSVRLTQRIVAPWLAAAETRTGVPQKLLDIIVRFSSGYRPGVISDDGHLGLMQLRPDLLDEMRVPFGDLMDPQENIRVGTIYMQRLIHRHGSIKGALIAFQDGPRPKGAPYGRKRIWFVREVLGLYYSSIRDFPTGFGVEAMEHVFSY